MVQNTNRTIDIKPEENAQKKNKRVQKRSKKTLHENTI